MKKSIILASCVLSLGLSYPIGNVSANNVKKEVLSQKPIIRDDGVIRIGKEIKPGRYQITSNQDSGVVETVANSSKWYSFNVTLAAPSGIDDSYGKQIQSVTCDLKKGETIKCDDYDVKALKFTPVEERANKNTTSLSCGQWVVGKDLKPGKYKFTVTDKNIEDSKSDVTIHNDSGEKQYLPADSKTFKATVHKGDVIDVDDINNVQLQKL